MLRSVPAAIALSVALATPPMSAARGIGITQPDREAGPPEDMIDFLGRRRECALWAAEPGEALPVPPPGSRREWLRCESLPEEELALRRRYQSNRRAMAFLDQAPGDFRSKTITVRSHDGPPSARVEHVEQRGLDAGGRIRWQMVLDREAFEGRATAVTVSWGRHPSRTIYLDARLFPALDLRSVGAGLRERPHEGLELEMRYGALRGWCGDADRDDRSQVSVYFSPGGVEMWREDRTNCNGNYQKLEPSAFIAPPRGGRR